MSRFETKTALVTGGGNGMGEACALRLASEGANVVVSDLLEAQAQRVALAIRESGGHAEAVACDVTDAGQVEASMQLAVSAFGGLDVVVAAAGIPVAGYRSGEHDPRVPGADPVTGFLDLELSGWHAVLGVNLDGAFLTTQRAVRQMLAQGRGGSIVLLTSVAAANQTLSGSVAYSAAKAGASAFMKHAAMLAAPSGIRVNAVGPGLIETNMSAGFLRDEARAKAVLSVIPLGHAGVPGDVAAAVLFLASDEARFITGEALYVDGGQFTG